jgi:hypothetical protein
MALAQRKISAILFILALASSRGEEPSTSTGSLEAAKRDLLALPSMSQPSGASGLNGLKVDVPTMPNTNSGSEISRPSTSLLPSNSVGPNGEYSLRGTKAPSEGWLVDAFKAADTRARAQRAADEQHSKDLQQIQSKSGGAAVMNPFSPYMSQWLSPHDPVLLQITGSNQPTGFSGGTRDSLDNLSAKAGAGAMLPGNSPLGAPTNPSLTENASSGINNLAAGATAVNPYLSTDATSVGRTNSLPSPSPSRTGVNSSFGAANQPNSSGGFNRPPESGHKPKLAEPSYTPPTAPLIDERKYFPQLHRF